MWNITILEILIIIISYYRRDGGKNERQLSDVRKCC